MNNLKEYIFPYESFIGGWYIPEKLCDDIINYFVDNKHKTNLGKVEEDGGCRVNFDKKKSIDLTINVNNFDYPFNEYQKYLSLVIKNFESKYDDVRNLDFYGLIEGYNIQYYEKNAGFKIWHCERSCNLNRNLVFMTYLNDVKDGGTEFKYQKIITTAKKGLTLIWPTDWTHIHRGQISKTSEKYIVTGWFGYLPKEIKK